MSTETISIKLGDVKLDVTGEVEAAEPEIGRTTSFDLESVEYQGIDVTDLIHELRAVKIVSEAVLEKL